MESVLRLKRQAEESVAAMKGATTTSRSSAGRRLPSVELEADDRPAKADVGRRDAPPPMPEERQYSSSKYAAERRELEEEKRSKAPTTTAHYQRRDERDEPSRNSLAHSSSLPDRSAPSGK